MFIQGEGIANIEIFEARMSFSKFEEQQEGYRCFKYPLVGELGRRERFRLDDRGF